VSHICSVHAAAVITETDEHQVVEIREPKSHHINPHMGNVGNEVGLCGFPNVRYRIFGTCPAAVGRMDPFRTFPKGHASDIDGMAGAGKLFSAKAFIKDNNMGGHGDETFDHFRGYGQVLHRRNLHIDGYGGNFIVWVGEKWIDDMLQDGVVAQSFCPGHYWPGEIRSDSHHFFGWSVSKDVFHAGIPL